jgi:serine/threonine protein kinase
MIEVKIENYKITGIIGHGGMGAIYYGEDLTLKRPVAIKMMRPEFLGDRQVVERFRAEAITTASFNHPNIATVYGLIQQQNVLLLIMEFVNGWTLSQLLRVHKVIPPKKAIYILNAALTAIGFAHKQGVIHRDLKPNNLMLNENGLIKVMDFGIARVLKEPKQTRTGQLIGTPKYMPPEQIRGEEPDARTDIYAIGIVLYQLLTGRAPFSGDSDYQLMKSQIEDPPPPPKEYTDKISDQLQTIILRALSKSSNDRYADVGQFAKALAACPESRDLAQDPLCDLIEGMQKKQPITIKPLNQQALKAIQSEIEVSSKSNSSLLDSPLGNIDAGRSNSAENQPKKSLFFLSKGGYFAISFLMIAVGIFIYWLVFKNSPETIKKTPASTHQDQTFHSIQDDRRDLKQNKIDQKPDSVQQEDDQWIIKR